MKYINKTTNYETTDGGYFSWLWCLLFGPLYFASRDNWAWVFISFFAFFITFGLSAIAIALFVYEINKTHLIKNGFVPA
jgi:hypothetical protein